MNHIADLQWFVPSAFLSRAAKKHWRLATIHLVDSCVRFDLVRVAVHRIAAPAHIIARLGVCFRMFILPNSNDLPRFWVCLGFFWATAEKTTRAKMNRASRSSHGL